MTCHDSATWKTAGASLAPHYSEEGVLLGYEITSPPRHPVPLRFAIVWLEMGGQVWPKDEKDDVFIVGNNGYFYGPPDKRECNVKNIRLNNLLGNVWFCAPRDATAKVRELIETRHKLCELEKEVLGESEVDE